MLRKIVFAVAADSLVTAMGKLDPKPHLAEKTMSAPWIVEVAWDAHKYDKVDVMAATGVLLGERHVITCAHPFFYESKISVTDKEYFVRCGSEKLGQGTRRSVERIIVHPDFKPGVAGQRRSKANRCDLAILALSEPVGIPPVTIADGHPLKFYSNVSVLGWPGGTDGTGNLHQVNTAVLPHNCGLAGAAGFREIVLANFAGPGQLQDGYSGGPVLLSPRDGGDAQLVAVTSQGIPGMSTEAAFGPPGIATDLTHHREWVNKIVQSNQ